MSRRRCFAVLGDPVDHSLSPPMHTRGFAAAGIDASYEAIRVSRDRPDDVERVMRSLVATGGGGNVTLPHKEAAARVVDAAGPSVVVTGACNCFWRDGDGQLAGSNTDVTAVESALSDLRAALRNPGAADVIVLGAGGAAAAAVLATHRAGSTARVANRTRERAERLRERLGRHGVRTLVVDWPATGTADIVVNATTLGMHAADPRPSSFDELRVGAVIDLVYGTVATAWAAEAKERGLPVIDGAEILVRQGAACYPHWFGSAGPVADLRAGLHDGRHRPAPGRDGSNAGE